MYLLMGHLDKFVVELLTSSGIVPKERLDIMCLLVLEIC